MAVNQTEVWEGAFFRALRALRHLYFKQEKREALDPANCQGCREIQDLIFKSQFRGDTTDPVGVDIHRPLTESEPGIDK